MSVRHKLANVIQKWLKFKGVITIRLTCTSQYFPIEVGIMVTTIILI